LLGGLWEFPGGKRESGETLEGCLIREVCEELGIEITVGEQFATVDHAFSHFSITLHAFLARYVSGRPWPIGGDAVRWVTLDQLDPFAFPKANHRLIAVLRSKVREA